MLSRTTGKKPNKNRLCVPIDDNVLIFIRVSGERGLHDNDKIIIIIKNRRSCNAVRRYDFAGIIKQ